MTDTRPKLMPRMELSTDARIIRNMLETKLIKEGVDLLTYAELNAAIGGRNVQGNAYGIFRNACKWLEAEHNRLAVVVRNEGVRLTDDPAGCLAQEREHRRRSARRSCKRAAHALCYDKLDAEQRRGLMAEAAIAGVAEQFSKPKALAAVVKQIDATAPKELATLPTIDTLRTQFKGNGATDDK